MTNEIDLVKLRSKLPHGYSAILQARIKRKFKKDYKVHSIRRALTENFRNDMIIEEAVLLVAELEKKRLERIETLKNIN